MNPDTDVLRRENGVFISSGIEPRDSAGAVALAATNTTESAHAMATRVAASARNTPKPVEADFLLSLQPHPGGVHEEA
jgi:hypothetical protein